MKLSRELLNGFIIFLGIGIYFLILEYLGYSDVFYLRIFNIVFIIFGVNRTIQANYRDGIRGYNRHFLAALLTSMIGAVLSIASLLIYIQFKGGDEYLQTLSKGFLFGGGELSIPQYCIGLLFESAAASMIISFSLMQYWKDKIEVINKVD